MGHGVRVRDFLRDFLQGLLAEGVLMSHLLIGPEGPGGVGGGVVELTPGVTGHVGRS